MSRQREREEFVAKMTQEGVPVEVARKLLRAAASLQRIAELQCSSEAADRDRVRCPGDRKEGGCLCRDYGSYRNEPGNLGHGKVPHVNVQEDRIERRVKKLCSIYGVKPIFQGDPRGAVVKLQVPSGKTDDWGATGLCVPA